MNKVFFSSLLNNNFFFVLSACPHLMFLFFVGLLGKLQRKAAEFIAFEMRLRINVHQTPTMAESVTSRGLKRRSPAPVK